MNSNRNTFTFDFRRLRVLQEFRERGTLAATAKALNLTPSAISQQIAALSREIGVPLLEPAGRCVRLTPQAELLLAHGSVMEAQLERARTDLAAFSGGRAGHVTLGTFSTAIIALVAPMFERLRRDRPLLHLSVKETEPPECFTQLDNGSLDLVVTVDFRNGPHRNDPRYHRVDLMLDPLLVAVPEHHPLAGRKTIELLALADEDWIIGAIRDPCQEISLTACTIAGFNPDIQHRVNDWVSVFALVAAGCGVALVPRLAVPPAPPSGIVFRPVAGPQRPGRNIYAAIRAGAERSPHLMPVLAELSAAAKALATPSAGRGPGSPGSRPRR